MYVDPGYQGRDVGRLLLSALIEASEAAGNWTIQTGIFPENTASLALHKAADSGSSAVGNDSVNSMAVGETSSCSNAGASNDRSGRAAFGPQNVRRSNVSVPWHPCQTPEIA